VRQQGELGIQVIAKRDLGQRTDLLAWHKVVERLSPTLKSQWRESLALAIEWTSAYRLIPIAMEHGVIRAVSISLIPTV